MFPPNPRHDRLSGAKRSTRRSRAVHPWASRRKHEPAGPRGTKQMGTITVSECVVWYWRQSWGGGELHFLWTEV